MAIMQQETWYVTPTHRHPHKKLLTLTVSRKTNHTTDVARFDAGLYNYEDQLTINDRC